MEALVAEIEDDLSWREEELRLLQNYIALASDGEADMLRRSLVVMLYAHFEGFSRFAFLAYVKAVNDSGIACREANYALVAATIADLFAAMRSSHVKAPEFRNTLPDDTQLHQFAREREFLERSDEILARRVEIADDVVNLEGNVKPVVLRKMLYQLGFAHDQFAQYEGTISRLLEYRNKIAHGSFRQGIDGETFQKLRDAVFNVILGIKTEIIQAIVQERYKRTA